MLRDAARRSFAAHNFLDDILPNVPTSCLSSRTPTPIQQIRPTTFTAHEPLTPPRIAALTRCLSCALLIIQWCNLMDAGRMPGSRSLGNSVRGFATPAPVNPNASAAPAHPTEARSVRFVQGPVRSRSTRRLATRSQGGNWNRAERRKVSPYGRQSRARTTVAGPRRLGTAPHSSVIARQGRRRSGSYRARMTLVGLRTLGVLSSTFGFRESSARGRQWNISCRNRGYCAADGWNYARMPAPRFNPKDHTRLTRRGPPYGRACGEELQSATCWCPPAGHHGRPVFRKAVSLASRRRRQKHLYDGPAKRRELALAVA
jgi:hypothetical protein